MLTKQEKHDLLRLIAKALKTCDHDAAPAAPELDLSDFAQRIKNLGDPKAPVLAELAPDASDELAQLKLQLACGDKQARAVLAALDHDKARTINAIVELTGYSRFVVKARLDELASKGLIAVETISTPGPNARIYRRAK